MPSEKSPKQLSLEKEYKKERKKVLRRIRNIQKRGYTLPENFAPKIPKTIRSESISNLQKYTTEYIYRRAVFTNPQGVTITGAERRQQERIEAAKKAAITRSDYYRDINKWWDAEPSYEPTDELFVTLSSVYEDFEEWTPSNYYSGDLQTLKQRDRDRGWGILQGAINELGKTQVALNIQKNAIRLSELTNRILYESGNKYREDSRNGEINKSLNEFQALIYGRALTRQESMKITSQGEINESHELI